ncbi:hypothetical protein Taro_020931 [Colocasia esculenta]|uniref:Uncharacterized protein n=1 Tax=Colocasia esculenta TaxID=4460 RepID=A0A843V3V1_COLES|nr:hypothetical protein [Colocasia esculenta]
MEVSLRELNTSQKVMLKIAKRRPAQEGSRGLAEAFWGVFSRGFQGEEKASLGVPCGPSREERGEGGLGEWGGSPMLAKGWTIDVHAPMLSTYGERPIKPMAGPKPPSSQERPTCNPGLDNEISIPGYVGPYGFYPPTGVCVVMVPFPPLKACLGGWYHVPFGLCRHMTYTLSFGTVSISVGVYRALPYQPR